MGEKDPSTDESFLWIAEKSLLAPAPQSWTQFSTDNGQVYYYNEETGFSTWEHPSDDFYRQLFREKKAEKETAFLRSPTRAFAGNSLKDDTLGDAWSRVLEAMEEALQRSRRKSAIGLLPSKSMLLQVRQILEKYRNGSEPAELSYGKHHYEQERDALQLSHKGLEAQLQLSEERERQLVESIKLAEEDRETLESELRRQINELRSETHAVRDVHTTDLDYKE